jgi:hypothetical protein
VRCSKSSAFFIFSSKGRRSIEDGNGSIKWEVGSIIVKSGSIKKEMG